MKKSKNYYLNFHYDMLLSNSLWRYEDSDII